ncbi:MAG: archaeosine biosynthesis radical SAM protein RaSEA [Thermoplasmata archaeon]|nr:archaeosine biosynthesis radical SAM protein RaSEA [Thermoplasmata archaeon]
MEASVARTVARDRRPPPADALGASRYVNLWSEPEAIGTRRVRAFVLILRTRGCYWADVKGCSMCGYAKDTLGRSATPAELAHQLNAALARYRDEPYVKLYTSGSFLDDREVDAESRRAIVAAFAGRAERLLFETLPEFATPATLAPLISAFPGTLEVAEGLESTQEYVLRRLINKGANPVDYFEAADRIREAGASPKGYLLLKPPYLTEREAVADVVRSVEVAAPRFDTLSVNPVHIQNGTTVEWLYRRGRYRPPWLWSLNDAMIQGAARRGRARLVTFPTAGGLPRGPHNCGECDARVLAALESASLDQTFDELANLACPCRTTWATTSALEPAGVVA